MTQPHPVRKMTLRELFCQVYHCSDEQFVNRVFWRSIHRRALPVAPLFRWFWPRFFQADFDLISEVGNVTRLSEIMNDLNSFRNDCQREHRLLHDQLRFRISGRRLYRVFTLARERYENQFGTTAPPSDPSSP